eukprot:gene19893-21836_t
MAFGTRESALLALAFALAAYFYAKNANQHVFIQRVLDGLLKEERSVNITKDLRVAVGFGSCMDLIVDGIPLVKKLGLKPPDLPQHHDYFKSKEMIAEAFAYFLKEGAASERFVDPELFKKIVAVAETLPGARWKGGGNAPVISKRMSMEGVKEVLVASNASKDYRALFPENMRFLGEADHKDDVHLILEFKVGERWGQYAAPRANRFVIHSDQNNPMLRSLEAFQSSLEDYKPDLVVTSALQMLDNYPFKEGEREERMQLMQDILESLKVHSHFEMASFSEKVMMRALLKYVVPFVTSLGMNEQELPNLVSMLKYGDITTISNANPRTATVLDSMRDLYNEMKEHSIRGLERIHVHTLAFQAILAKKSSKWKNTRASSAKASLVANRYVCNNDDINIRNAKLLMDESFAKSVAENSERISFNADNPVSCWDESDYEICVAPVLVCTQIYQTVGGGDNVSPAGIVLQL